MQLIENCNTNNHTQLVNSKWELIAILERRAFYMNNNEYLLNCIIELVKEGCYTIIEYTFINQEVSDVKPQGNFATNGTMDRPIMPYHPWSYKA